MIALCDVAGFDDALDARTGALRPPDQQAAAFGGLLPCGVAKYSFEVSLADMDR